MAIFAVTMESVLNDYDVKLSGDGDVLTIGTETAYTRITQQASDVVAEHIELFYTLITAACAAIARLVLVSMQLGMGSDKVNPLTVIVSLIQAALLSVACAAFMRLVSDAADAIEHPRRLVAVITSPDGPIEDLEKARDLRFWLAVSTSLLTTALTIIVYGVTNIADGRFSLITSLVTIVDLLVLASLLHAVVLASFRIWFLFHVWSEDKRFYNDVNSVRSLLSMSEVRVSPASDTMLDAREHTRVLRDVPIADLPGFSIVG